MNRKSVEPKLVLDYSELGSVVFTRNKLARKIKITLSPFKPIRVTVPSRVSLKRAKRFFDSELVWVTKQKQRMLEYETWHSDYFKRCQQLDMTHAKTELAKRITQLALQYGFKFGKVSVKQQKTIWGSCTFKNDINLNGYLTLLPEHLRDYVILHELTHTRVKNHSKTFWAEMDKVVIDARSLDRELKKYPLPI